MSEDFDFNGKRVEIGCHSNFIKYKTTLLEVRKSCSRVVFGNGATVVKGSSIIVHHGKLILGKGSYIGQGALVVCHKYVEFQENATVAWNSQVYDTNFHFIHRKGENFIRDCAKPIIIGANVWCGNNVTVTAGAVIPADSIVAQCSLFNKDFSDVTTHGNLFAGVPAVLKKSAPLRPVIWNSKLEKKLHRYFDETEHNGIFELPPDYPEDFYKQGFFPESDK